MSKDLEQIWIQLKQISDQLKRIADVLETLVPEQAMPETEPPTCPHPEEMRVSFGTTQGQDDWQCSICQFRSIPL